MLGSETWSVSEWILVLVLVSVTLIGFAVGLSAYVKDAPAAPAVDWTVLPAWARTKNAETARKALELGPTATQTVLPVSLGGTGVTTQEQLAAVLQPPVWLAGSLLVATTDPLTGYVHPTATDTSLKPMASGWALPSAGTVQRLKLWSSVEATVTVMIDGVASTLNVTTAAPSDLVHTVTVLPNQLLTLHVTLAQAPTETVALSYGVQVTFNQSA